jgi:hypothetical protein
VTISAGVSAMVPDVGDPAALLEAADAALYSAKGTGKNRVRSGGWAAGRPGDASNRFGRAALARERAHGT